MHRRFYILSRFKLPTLETGPGDLIMEDVIDIHSDHATIVLDNKVSAQEARANHPDLKYCFVVDVQEVAP